MARYRRGVEKLEAAARKLGQHPQDHGWRELYRLFAHGLGHGSQPLVEVVAAAKTRQPGRSDVHLVTLLGIAVNLLAGMAVTDLVDTDRPAADRLADLEDLLRRYRTTVDVILTLRQNSFTAARRFLVPQVLLAAYFAQQPQPARFADLGTGLGILPRQLNSKALFERFAYELTWPHGYPTFQPIPLEARHGVDRGPFPDLVWVRSCYGPSAYYTAQFHELIDVHALPEVQAAEVQYHELDMTNLAALCRFLTEYEINVVNLCYTLYEIEPPKRTAIVDSVAESLSEPGLMIVTEPHGELSRPGCTVAIRDNADPVLRPLCAVTDGHFRGRVTALAGYREFLERYPIRFERRAGAVDVDAPPDEHAAG
jgi:hypothetical protein